MATIFVIPPTPTRAIVTEEKTMEQEMRSWTQIITNQALIIGSGTPEGVVEGIAGSNYQDRDGVTGTFRYGKKFDAVGGDKKLGWILI